MKWMLNDAQVLGISSPPPVAGSPLITPEMITAYCLTFFVSLIILYTLFHFIKKPLLLSHKLKLVLFISLFLKIALVTTIGLAASFWLLPTPRVEKTVPKLQETGVITKPRIEIAFNRPVNRGSLIKKITPDTPGVWTYEDPIYATHLYKKLVFHPTISLRPSTKYTVELSNISNFLKLSPAKNYSYSFTTKKTPTVTSVVPSSGSQNVEINSPIKVLLSDVNDSESIFDFQFSPEVVFDVTMDNDRRSYSITPKNLQQGTTYSFVVKKTDTLTHILSNSIVERSNTQNAYEGTFTTKEQPGVSRFQPSGGEIQPESNIEITFTQPMDRTSVESTFITNPKLNGIFSWLNDSSVIFNPTDMQYETTYQVKIPKDTKSKGGGYLTSNVEKSFTTIGRVHVEKMYPENGWKAVGITNEIKVTFDQEVDKADAQSKFKITPTIEGAFSWYRNTLIFHPSTSYSYSTLYTVEIQKDVKSIRGLASTENFQTQFTTQDETIKLGVPSYLQKYSLSCEIAALKMALEFRGISLSEDEILAKIGTDNTPKDGNIWGNPHLAFVGNVNGKQMVTGYGVYWEPIARVARNYRNATEFRGWNISQLTKMIKANNPVIVWVYSSNGTPTGWDTLTGTRIQAVRGEHAVVAVGFVGQIDNPTAIIVNDPLLGQVQWPRLFFDMKWNAFGQSGVVVY